MRISLFIVTLFYGVFAVAEGTCVQCHGEVAAAMAGTLHDEVPCSTCHVGGAEHARAPGVQGTVLAFHNESGQARSAPCQSCHADVRVPTTGNPHHQADVACNDCHAVHSDPAAQALDLAGLDRLAPGSASCHGCHQEVFAQFELSERHRLMEGSISCISCHDPHGTESRSHLGGFKASECAGCHVDAEGPFVFEHAASRTEGCGACHVPHGSPNRHLLTHQRVGELCYSCHAIVPAFHLGFNPSAPARFDEDTVCTNCHVTIHGSNLDRNFLR